VNQLVTTKIKFSTASTVSFKSETALSPATAMFTYKPSCQNQKFDYHVAYIKPLVAPKMLPLQLLWRYFEQHIKLT